MTAVREAVLGKPWCPPLADEIARMRSKLESSANPRSLKRGWGGLNDVEFAVQLLQLKYAREQSAILTPNIWDALDAMAVAGVLAANEAETLREGYSFLRFVEARLRVVTDRPQTEIPEHIDDLEKLARRSGFESATEFSAKLTAIRTAVRAVYGAIVQRERG
jgi:glutamate-ammonia-ligase adenylyltransferase